MANFSYKISPHISYWDLQKAVFNAANLFFWVIEWKMSKKQMSPLTSGLWYLETKK